ncbi:MAG: aminoacyl-tRNA hydrolase [Deltaproteobacteria bacterium]|jgi:PTH1 family peptidyl-tRNA hydrolase|nr:aminoacyl-tRNA hydrolase [Deltaproteobacteria bacterium]
MAREQEHQDEIAAIVGLGNPGKQYEKTRHNAGFRVVDLLAGDLSIFLQERKFKASWGAGSFEDRRVLLIKPLTFMNRSGEPVAEILGYFGIQGSRVLVIHDDLDLHHGRTRLVRQGGSGGHRGVSSVIEHLKCQSFPRLKLGIGRPLHDEPVETYVLQAPSGDEARIFDEMIIHGVQVAKAVLALGLEQAMNAFN